LLVRSIRGITVQIFKLSDFVEFQQVCDAMNNDDIAATEPSSGSPVGTLMRLGNLQAELTHNRS
jgi:hypothetical protein